MTSTEDDEDRELRSVALQTTKSILQARQRAEQALLEAQAALRESSARLQLAMEAGQMGDWEWNVDSGAVHWSPALERIHGLASGTFGGTFEDFQRDTHPDDRDRVLRTIRDCLDRGGDYRLEYRIIKPDGAVAWLEARGRLSLGDDDRPRSMTGVCMDVTTRKQAEEALRDETRILEVLNDTGMMLSQKLELVELVQAVTDAATVLSGARFGAFFYNVTAESGESYLLYTLSGAPREAFEGFGQPRATPLFGPTFHGDDTIRSADVQSDPRYGKLAPHFGMPKGHPPVRSYLAVPVIARSGEVLGGLLFGHPEPDVFTARAERLVSGVAAQAAVAIDNARLYEGAQRAAAERKRLLESERAARAAAERMSEMKDQFLATLSHELRTPLSAILGWSQVLRRGAKNGDDVERGLETIERNARMQTNLIEDLLDMSRIASGKVRLDVEAVHPATFIEAAIDTVRPAANAKGIALDWTIDANVGPIPGDAARLQQVVWNLVSNAIKFTPRDGRIAIAVRREAHHVEIRVTDSGIGIRPEFLAHLFERFRQADASTTRKYGGLGLGLSIVKNLVELHGGSVFARSDGEEQGSTFIVHLPAPPADIGEALRDRVAPLLESLEFRSLDLSGLKVLLVDDDADSRDLASQVLSDCGAQVVSAESAVQALELVQAHRPHVVVSDIGMPDIDGIELLRRIRDLGEARGGNTPAIALTAFARAEDRRRALDAGYSVHLSKPVESAKLITTVAAVAGLESPASSRAPQML